MAKMNLILPALGEGVIEATINKWLVAEGAVLKEDQPLVEIATDKVDTEIPSPAAGKLVSIIVTEGSVAKVGDTLAVIEISDARQAGEDEKIEKEVARIRETIEETKKEEKEVQDISVTLKSRTPSGKFISPLVKSIVARENISYSEIDSITGTGMDGRITKDDILKLIEKRKKDQESAEALKKQKTVEAVKQPDVITTGDEIVEMDRVRKLIAEHMVLSKKVSAHVTSFIDADVTKLVNWRNSVKDKFLAARDRSSLSLRSSFMRQQRHCMISRC